jgi:hypothetical protein
LSARRAGKPIWVTADSEEASLAEIWRNPEEEDPEEKWTREGLEIVDPDSLSEEDWKELRMVNTKEDLEEGESGEMTPAEEAQAANTAAIEEIRRINAAKTTALSGPIRQPTTEDERMLTVKRFDLEIGKLAGAIGLLATRVYPQRDDSFLAFRPNNFFVPKLMAELIEVVKGLQSQITSIGEDWCGMTLDEKTQKWDHPPIQKNDAPIKAEGPKGK